MGSSFIGTRTAGRFTEMTDQLVPEEVERYAVVVATSQLAAQLGDVELHRLIKVVGRDGEVKNVTVFSHD